jgi:transcriptional regulator with XRE-family HTH domain
MATAGDPATPRRKMSGELREARTSAHLTREATVKALGWSLSKLVRIEAGQQGVSLTDLRAMLELYNVTDAGSVYELTDLAQESRRPTWWSSYRGVISKQYGQYLGYEGSASYLRVFHPLLVPGLLHTAEYAFELLRIRMPEDRARLLVDLRMERQERVLRQPNPPEMKFVVAEEAFIRKIGGAAGMARQLEHLLAIGSAPAVSLQVLPLSVGAHVGLTGSFILLGLDETKEDLLFLEGPAGDLTARDDRQVIEPFIDHFNALSALALSAEETRPLIRHYMESAS